MSILDLPIRLLTKPHNVKRDEKESVNRSHPFSEIDLTTFHIRINMSINVENQGAYVRIHIESIYMDTEENFTTKLAFLEAYSYEVLEGRSLSFFSNTPLNFGSTLLEKRIDFVKA